MTHIGVIIDREQFSVIFDASPIGVALVQNSKIIEVNTKFVEMHNYHSKDQVRNLHMLDVVPKRFGDEIIQRGIKRLEKKQVLSQYESIGVRSDGTEFPILVHANLIKYQGKDTIISYVTDLTELKFTEQKLAQSEQHFRNLFEHSPIATVIHDFSKMKEISEKYNLSAIEDLDSYLENNPKVLDEINSSVKRLFVNSAFNELLGIDNSEEYISGEVLVFQTYDSAKKFNDTRNEMIKGKNSFTFETTLKRKDGKLIDVIVKRSIDLNTESPWQRVYTSTIDVSDYQAAKRQIENREKLFNNFFQNSPIPTIIHDVAGFYEVVEKYDLKSKHNIREFLSSNPDITNELKMGIKRITINKAFVNLMKIKDVKDFLSGSKDIFQTQKAIIAFSVARERMIKGETNFSFETQFVRSDGVEISMVVSRIIEKHVEKLGTQEIQRMYTFNVDTTEINLAKQRQLASEEKYKSIFDFALHGILLTKLDDLKIYDYNSQLANLLGYDPQELIGKDAYSIIIPEERFAASQKLSLVKEGVSTSVQRKLIKKDGTEIATQVLAKQIEIDGVKFILTFIEDISERVKSDEVLQKTREQLFQAQKMEAIGRMSGSIAHDFNNLLTLIGLNTEYLQMEIPESSPLSDTVNSIAESVQKAGKITSELLLFSRNRVMSEERIEINELLTQFSNSFGYLLKEPIEYSFSKSSEKLFCMVDPLLLEQVIMNIVINARDAMPNGGELKIIVDKVPKMEIITNREKLITDMIRINIKDTGHGIPENTLPHIFEPFYTTKEIGKGSGLGLATSYTIVDQFGGIIDVSSEIGVGTLFEIFLPIDTGMTTTKTTKTMSNSVSKKFEDVSILLVDDDHNIRGIVKKIFENLKMNVIDVDNGMDAFEIFKKSPEKFDLILTDIMMPGLLGTELINKIRKLREEVPVIYMTGFSKNLNETAKTLTFNEIILHKPFHSEELIEGISKLVGFQINTEN